jgi:glucose/arabinose dehydrogenase
VWVGSAPGDLDRLFVVERMGRIRIIELHEHDERGDILSTPFLDLGGLISTGGEQGLLGMAFHPGYAANGRFFVNYTDPAGDTQVIEYRVSADPDVADAMPVQVILSLVQPFANHNGGNLAFGPDGMLYIGTGDGGGGLDPDNRAQDGLDNLGKMLRLDVDLPAPFVPADNPFVGDPDFNDEVWALGLRNPWRYSFDRLTGDLYIADVGQDEREEISIQPGSSAGGENYGWRCMEGFTCTGLAGCICNDARLTLPVHDYGHGGGNCSITGGFVYRGADLPELRGTYFFADFCSGRIWSFRHENGVVVDFEERTDELHPGDGRSIDRVTSFGEDDAGELYIVDITGGQIFRIVPGNRFSRPTPQAAGCGSGFHPTGRAAAIEARGSTSLAAADLVLSVRDAAPGASGFFLYGGERVELPFGNGRRCVGAGESGLFRTRPVAPCDDFGCTNHPFAAELRSARPGGPHFSAASTWHFQFCYRDPAAGGAGFDTSDLLTLEFGP